MEEGDGYLVSGSIELGELQPASQPVTLRSLTAGSACSVDPEKDAVIPVEISMHNETEGFSVETQLQIVPLVPESLDPAFPATSSIVSVVPDPDAPPMGSIGFEVGYSSGPSCTDRFAFGGTTDTVRLQTDLPEGGTTTARGFLIVHDFYAPAHPDGDHDRLRGIVLELHGAPFQGSIIEFNGPGGELIGNVGYFPLSPDA